MIGTGMLRSWSLLLLFSIPARAQSDALLESVRVHRAEVAEQAKVELDTCVAAKCADRERLTLLTGFLELSEGNAPAAAQRLLSPS